METVTGVFVRDKTLFQEVLPFVFKWEQLLMTPALATTINKPQGQTPGHGRTSSAGPVSSHELPRDVSEIAIISESSSNNHTSTTDLKRSQSFKYKILFTPEFFTINHVIKVKFCASVFLNLRLFDILFT
jgi:hypothetical protein